MAASYKYFVSCCRRYRNSKEKIKSTVYLDPRNQVCQHAAKIIRKELNLVDETICLISEKDAIFAELLRQKLIEGRSFYRMQPNQILKLSPRQLIRRYPQRLWEDMYNAILTQSV